MNIMDVIQNRKTLKVIGDINKPWAKPSDKFQKEIQEVIAQNEFAPFHYPCDKKHQEKELNSIVPWRIYVLDAESCRNLLAWLLSQKIDAGKISGMLATAGNMVICTWLPDSPKENVELSFQGFEGSERNMEHIASASCAIQNMLLAATSKNIHNYWSSGGKLRSENVFQKLNIPLDEVLLGAMFFFENDTKDASLADGGLRNLKGEKASWQKNVVV